MDGPISLKDLLEATEKLREVAPAPCRVLTEPVEAVVARIMVVAKETGTDPLAVARVYMRPEPDLRVVVPAIILESTPGLRGGG